MEKIQNFFDNKVYKDFMSMLYGWGASVVIAGALFKILHWKGADVMLMVGMLTEAIIFFFSAFEKRHEDPKWERVYPQLADGKKSNGKVVTPTATTESASQKLDKMFEEANIDAALIDRLGKGLNKLSDNANQMADVTNAAAATNEYVKVMHKATESIGSLSSSYAKASEIVSKSVEGLGVNQIDGEQLQQISKRISSLNTAYELQLESSKKAADISSKLNETLGGYLNEVSKSAANTEQFNKEMHNLSTRMNALNTVYGNMLSAMNVKH
ncbi:MAG: gliding motility protein GldL [Lentimicrobiaceae bacterium]|jgi:gliding motility-associated protein GldL|nr:gliding motility protein GldL [Lentimicrobiaceae bacterium]